MNTPVTTDPTRFLGCDVGKHEIVCFDSRDGMTRKLPNEPAALRAFARTLDAGCLVVCEATGGYEAALLDATLQAGVPAHRADARRVKAFIRSRGTLAKTDTLDARALAAYARERHRELARWQPRQPAREALRQLVSTRSDLVRERAAYKNRLAAPGSRSVHPRLTRIRAAIEAEIAGIEADINALIQAVEPLRSAASTLRTIKGLGAVTAAALLALLPELGTLDRRRIASLAGLAPHPRQSGSANAYRRVRGGRPEVRRVIFMAALSAARHDPSLSPFYRRLVDNGKKPLVALVATMRKLITIANARLRNAPQPI